MEKLEKLVIEGAQLKGALNLWVDPRGKCYRMTGFAMHDSFAWDYLMSKFKGDRFTNLVKLEEELEREHVSYSYELLVKRGWVRILCWTDGEVAINTEKPRRYLTAEQKAFLKEWELWNKDHNLNIKWLTES